MPWKPEDKQEYETFERSKYSLITEAIGCISYMLEVSFPMKLNQLLNCPLQMKSNCFQTPHFASCPKKNTGDNKTEDYTQQ